MRQNAARLGANPERIVLVGHSSGGTHVATWAYDQLMHGPDGPRVAGIVLVSARLKADNRKDNPNAAGVEAYFGRDPSVYAAQSPLTVGTTAVLPTFIVVAEYDNPFLDTYGAESFAAQCKARGRCGRFLRLEGHNHISMVGSFNTANDRLGFGGCSSVHFRGTLKASCRRDEFTRARLVVRRSAAVPRRAPRPHHGRDGPRPRGLFVGPVSLETKCGLALDTLPGRAAVLDGFVTHFCAPGFFFLMGAGVSLFAESRAAKGWSGVKISRSICVRGLVLILVATFLEVPAFLIGILSGPPSPASNPEFAIPGMTQPRWVLTVLFALGASMAISGASIRLRAWAWALCAATAILATAITTPGAEHFDTDYGLARTVLMLSRWSHGVWSQYPLIPWFGIGALGVLFGRWLAIDRRAAFRSLPWIGAAAITLALLLRALGGFGNLRRRAILVDRVPERHQVPARARVHALHGGREPAAAVGHRTRRALAFGDRTRYSASPAARRWRTTSLTCGCSRWWARRGSARAPATPPSTSCGSPGSSRCTSSRVGSARSRRAGRPTHSGACSDPEMGQALLLPVRESEHNRESLARRGPRSSHRPRTRCCADHAVGAVDINRARFATRANGVAHLDVLVAAVGKMEHDTVKVHDMTAHPELHGVEAASAAVTTMTSWFTRSVALRLPSASTEAPSEQRRPSWPRASRAQATINLLRMVSPPKAVSLIAWASPASVRQPLASRGRARRA